MLQDTFQNEGKSESRIRISRESSAYGKKRNLAETIGKVQEENLRLRKKHDLIKYQREKVSNQDISLSNSILRENVTTHHRKYFLETAKIKHAVGRV